VYSNVVHYGGQQKIAAIQHLEKKKNTLLKVNVKVVIIQAQESGWMDQALVLDWINRVWQKCPGALLNLRSMPILDSFRGHGTEEVKILKSRNTDQAVIPGGLTLILQPFDVCINRPFKATLYTQWMAAGEYEFTPTAKIKRPDVEQFCEWIREA
jgi:hypothetical protein